MKESPFALCRRCWPIFTPFLLLGILPLVVGDLAGWKWRLIAGVGAMVIWGLFRPWRFGLATPEERRQVCIAGTICLAGLVINYAITYFRL